MAEKLVNAVIGCRLEVHVLFLMSMNTKLMFMNIEHHRAPSTLPLARKEISGVGEIYHYRGSTL